MTSIFAMPPPLAAEQKLGTRSYIYASKPEVQVLESSTTESRLTFLNSLSGADPQSLSSYILSASNTDFLLMRSSNVLTRFFYDDGLQTSVQAVPGHVQAERFHISQPQDTKKSVVLKDFNAASTENFAGMGFYQGAVHYQAPYANAHTFYVATDAFHSDPLLHIQKDFQTGTAQVGIGTQTIPSNVSLYVTGKTVIEGDVQIQGNFTFDTSGFVQLDPSTNKIVGTQLPERLVFLNSNTNLIDYSILPGKFSGIRWNQSVGIGTRKPLQKLHVEGGAIVSERLGIGASNYGPAARIHAVEAIGVIPTAILENNSFGNIIEARASGNPILTVSSTGVGIGKSTVEHGVALDVNGDVRIHGALLSSNVVIDGSTAVTISDLVIADAGYTALKKEKTFASDGTLQNITMNGYVPYIFHDGVSTDRFVATTSNAIRFQACGAIIEGDLILNSQLYVTSDRRRKKLIMPIENPLDRLDRIHGYTYTLESGKRQAGLLAQEVREVLPEAVQTLPDQYMGVAYDSVIALLVEAVRDLRGEVKELRSQLGSHQTS